MCLRVDRARRADINIIMNHRWLSRETLIEKPKSIVKVKVKAPKSTFNLLSTFHKNKSKAGTPKQGEQARETKKKNPVSDKM